MALNINITINEPADRLTAQLVKAVLVTQYQLLSQLQVVELMHSALCSTVRRLDPNVELPEQVKVRSEADIISQMKTYASEMFPGVVVEFG